MRVELDSDHLSAAPREPPRVQANTAVRVHYPALAHVSRQFQHILVEQRSGRPVYLEEQRATEQQVLALPDLRQLGGPREEDGLVAPLRLMPYCVQRGNARQYLIRPAGREPALNQQRCAAGCG